jgi:hypothetical protein
MDERTAETIASMVGVSFTGTLARDARSTFFLCFPLYFVPLCILNRGSNIRRNYEHRRPFLSEH